MKRREDKRCCETPLRLQMLTRNIIHEIKANDATQYLGYPNL